jgi:hypothetical protein
VHNPTCYDPIVLVHARALLTSSFEGRTAYIDADLRDHGKILADPILTETLDLRRPVALMLVGVLHFIPDGDDPYGIVDTLKNALAPGSLMVLSHGSYDLLPATSVRKLTKDDYPGNDHFHSRTREQVHRFFDGFDLVQPGPDGTALPTSELGVISAWGRANGDKPPAAEAVSTWGGVGRVARRAEGR